MVGRSLTGILSILAVGLITASTSAYAGDPKSKCESDLSRAGELVGLDASARVKLETRGVNPVTRTKLNVNLEIRQADLAGESLLQDGAALMVDVGADSGVIFLEVDGFDLVANLDRDTNEGDSISAAPSDVVTVKDSDGNPIFSGTINASDCEFD